MARLQDGYTALDLTKAYAKQNKAECVALLEAAMNKVNHSDPSSYPTLYTTQRHSTNIPGYHIISVSASGPLPPPYPTD